MCRPGQSVKAGQPLLILECMKMEGAGGRSGRRRDHRPPGQPGR
ncbi:MAG: hypothetical protein E2O89_03450 [Alphaproteobacteria bacterium]|nr:MAG: hypothetical protein E2O89_03450 [Alphaproteobacteria bacterium]